jgi:hypothetical protein
MSIAIVQEKVQQSIQPEAVFLDVVGEKVLRVFLFTVTSQCYSQSPLHAPNKFTPPPPPLSKSGLKLVCNVNIVDRNLKSENSQDCAQKPQQIVRS